MAFPEGIKNTRNRPVSQCFEEVDDNNSQTYDVASLMSYDIHGNIIKAVKDIPVLSHLTDGYFSIETEFDLLTGKTNKITLQKGKRDQWIHKYFYDRDNRITSVYTSRDAINWENDAKYFYNLAGSLARAELGELKVQGLDYASTINGWIKGVNGGSMTPEFDIGKDGHNDPSNTNRFVGRDAFGYLLTFFNDDYINISGQHLDANRAGSDLEGKTSGRELFNGNIMHMQVALPKGRGANSWVGNNDPSKLSRELVAEVLGNVYHYDQLNRITKHYSFDEFAAPSSGTQYLGGTWLNSGKTGMQKYYENFAYDANGNITSLNRNSGTIPTGATDYKMDEMTYNYDKVTVSITLQQNTSITYSLLNLQSNKLYKVDDNVNATFYKDDIDAQAAGNYSYDNLGNLIQDDAEEIDEIKWTNSGKIKSVKRVNTSAKADLHFGYDEAGQRLWKLVIPKEEILPASTPKTYKNKKQEFWDTTWYLGSARYSVQHVRNTNVPDDLYKQWVLEELDIIGEKRHGLYKPEEVIGQRNFIVNAELDYNEDGTFNFSNSWQNTQNSGKFVPLRDEEVRIMIRGCKQYELSNHLGNVLVTVSDRKSSRASSTTATLAEYYVPYVLTISDYYAFGSSIKERTVSFSATYRYGFNNQEQDAEMGEYYAFEYRIHDARLGRFLSVDPLAPEYPWNSPYAFAENRVVDCKDLEGAERLVATISLDPNNSSKTNVIVDVQKQGVPLTLQINFVDCAGNIINSRIGGPDDLLSKQIIDGCENTPLTNLGQNSNLKQYCRKGVVYRDNKNSPSPIKEDERTGLEIMPFNSLVSRMEFSLIKNISDWQYSEERTNILSVQPHFERTLVSPAIPVVVELPWISVGPGGVISKSDFESMKAFRDKYPEYTNLNVVRNRTEPNTPEWQAFYNNNAAQISAWSSLGITASFVTNLGQTKNSKTATLFLPPVFRNVQTGWDVTTEIETRDIQINSDCTTTVGPVKSGVRTVSEVPLDTIPTVGTTPWRRIP